MVHSAASGGDAIVVIRDSDGEILSHVALSGVLASRASFFISDERLLLIPDAVHRSPTYVLWSLDPAAPKQLGSVWDPSHGGSSGYEVQMSEAIIGGIQFLRTSNGNVRAYDWRQ
jgi:hypothetical protein